MRRSNYVPIGLTLLLTSALANAAIDNDASNFQCKGQVERRVWSLWEKDIKRQLEKDLLQKRLKEQGDVYALYNFQTAVHNAAAMARRCDDLPHLAEIAGLINQAYDALSKGDDMSSGRRWICRGGLVCNNTNHLLDKEVMLNSVQFLGLASSLANAFATSGKPLSPVEENFINETIEIVFEHLVRWGDEGSIYAITKLIEATPADITNKSSALFFNDKYLWLITIYAEISGALEATNSRKGPVAKQYVPKLRKHVSALLKLFSARITTQKVKDSRLGVVEVADIDRGYWRLYPDNAYAGYRGEEKPVTCGSEDPQKPGPRRPQFKILPSAATLNKNTGWDFSHARRLVHALDALSRNRRALRSTFALSDKDLPAGDLTKRFANNLVAVVWNGDMNRPLFSNYWSGANGWFRVAYDNGTGNCREGYPPYGMSEAFLTGGYITWAQYQPVIGEIGKRFFRLDKKPDEAMTSFMLKYYPSLSREGNQRLHTLTEFEFLPTLVEVGIK